MQSFKKSQDGSNSMIQEFWYILIQAYKTNVMEEISLPINGEEWDQALMLMCLYTRSNLKMILLWKKRKLRTNKRLSLIRTFWFIIQSNGIDKFGLTIMLLCFKIIY
jgi:hypothetical protein